MGQKQASNMKGKRVDVYRNLNDECMSILSRETSSEDYGNVIKHVDSVVVRNASFVVREAGRKKVLEQERKNVHAFIRGEVEKVEEEVRFEEEVRITYNPYEYDSFVTVEEEKSVREADMVLISMNRGVIAKGVETV